MNPLLFRYATVKISVCCLARSDIHQKVDIIIIYTLLTYCNIELICWCEDVISCIIPSVKAEYITNSGMSSVSISREL